VNIIAEYCAVSCVPANKPLWIENP